MVEVGFDNLLSFEEIWLRRTLIVASFPPKEGHLTQKGRMENNP